MDIRKGIVGIKSHPDSKIILGTGFFVEGGYILTCAHVLEDYYQPDKTFYFEIEGQTTDHEARVVVYSSRAEHDFAILSPTTKVEYTPLPIASSQYSQGDGFSIFGYPDLGTLKGLNGIGTIMGWSKDADHDTVLQLDSRQITFGFSGAPIWDDELNVVVGIMQQGIEDESIGRPAFAIPIELANEVVKELRPDLRIKLQKTRSRKSRAIVRNVRRFAFYLALLVALVGLGGGGYWFAIQPKEMTGDFNIAVAQFGEIQTNGDIKPSAQAEKISSALFNFLDSEYRTTGLGFTVEIAHKNMPLILEESQAEKLAQKVKADIVIFGNVFIQGGQAEFSPRFYVAAQPDTTELTGQNELAYPIIFNVSDLVSQELVNASLQKRAEILVNFTKGLVYFSQDDADSANRALQAAIIAANDLDQPFEGQEVLYLLASRVDFSQDEIKKAHAMLDDALALNPNYARAYLARGNIYYIQASQQDFDLDLLKDALDEYEKAYQSPEQPEGANIPIKAHISLGNAYVVRAQKTNDKNDYDQATSHYSEVIKIYEKANNPDLNEYAAIAYFGLGAAYERQKNTAEAIDAYQQALELTDAQEFKTRIQGQIDILTNP